MLDEVKIDSGSGLYFFERPGSQTCVARDDDDRLVANIVLGMHGAVVRVFVTATPEQLESIAAVARKCSTTR